MITVKVVRKAMMFETFEGYGWVLYFVSEQGSFFSVEPIVYPNSIAAFQAGLDIVRMCPHVFDRVSI